MTKNIIIGILLVIPLVLLVTNMDEWVYPDKDEGCMTVHSSMYEVRVAYNQDIAMYGEALGDGTDTQEAYYGGMVEADKHLYKKLAMQADRIGCSSKPLIKERAA